MLHWIQSSQILSRQRSIRNEGALGEQAEVYDAKMTGLSTASKATKCFILNRDWIQKPSHIIFYADNSATVSCIYKGTPGKAQEQSLIFRNHIKDILKETEDTLIAISWVPGVDGEVNQTMLLVLNLSQLKSCRIRLRERLSQVKPVLPMTRQE